jgi:hypothetical protein
MDTRRKGLFVRDAREEVHEVPALLMSERRAKRIIVRSSHPPDLRHRPLPLGRQVQRVDSPIFRVVATFDEPALLELVHQNDEPARKDAQHARESLLTEPGTGRDRAKDSRLGSSQLQLGEPLPEPHCRVTSDLGEQERSGSGATHGSSRLVALFHATHDSQPTSYALHIVHSMNE